MVTFDIPVGTILLKFLTLKFNKSHQNSGRRTTKAIHLYEYKPNYEYKNNFVSMVSKRTENKSHYQTITQYNLTDKIDLIAPCNYNPYDP